MKCIQDEIPFEIPDSWSWVRLNELGIYSKGPFGSNLTKDMFVNKTTKNRIKVYEQKNAIEKNHLLGHYYISEEKFKEMQGYVVVSGDIIVSCAGTIGEIYELPNEAEIGIINQALMRIKLYNSIIKQYFLLYFDCVLKSESKEKGKGTGMKNIPPFSVLKNMLMPIPSKKYIITIIDRINQYEHILNRVESENISIHKIKNKIKQKVLCSIFSPNSSYKSYYEKGYTIENDAEILDNLRKPINATEREQRLNKSKDRYPYYGATGQVGFINEYLFDGEYVLVGEDGAPFLDKYKSKAYIINGKSWVNNHAHILKSKSNNKFLMYYLNWFNYQDYVSGTTRLKLTQGNLRKIPFINISKVEKDIIVEKLDKVFESIDNM